MFDRYVIYKAGSMNIETCVSFHFGQLVCQYSKKPINQIEGDLIPLDLAVDLISDIEEKYYSKQGWLKVTSDEYNEQLECLPPYKYIDYKDITGFLCSEFTSGPYTACYVRYKGSYYCTTVDITKVTPRLENLLNLIGY